MMFANDFRADPFGDHVSPKVDSRDVSPKVDSWDAPGGEGPRPNADFIEVTALSLSLSLSLCRSVALSLSLSLCCSLSLSLSLSEIYNVDSGPRGRSPPPSLPHSTAT